MVTTLRRRATPLAALLTALFLAGPALAGPPPSVQVLSALRSMPAELAPTSRVGSSVLAPQALLGSSPEAKAATESQQTPATPQTSFSAERGWWSRRTTVQKTWFIIGMVGGAYGIYALTSHKSSSGSGGGMSGGSVPNPSVPLEPASQTCRYRRIHPPFSCLASHPLTGILFIPH